MFIEQRVRFTYPDALRDQPLIYRLIREYNVLTNILEARVTADESWLVLAVRGEVEWVQKGLAWIAEQGVQVEILGSIEEGA
jgi:ABC-type methionine transport system ATPase subunit